LGKINEMSEDMDEVVETKPVEAVEEPAAVVEEPEAVVEEEAVEPAVVPKKKRKRSEAQINALASARKSKLSKMSSKKKPVKIERQYETPISDFSWTKEICKASILASLGLASIYVQQKCAQTPPPPPEVVQVEEKQVPKKKPTVKTGGGKDPFAGYR
jgi:hypothetical protein